MGEELLATAESFNDASSDASDAANAHDASDAHDAADAHDADGASWGTADVGVPKSRGFVLQCVRREATTHGSGYRKGSKRYTQIIFLYVKKMNDLLKSIPNEFQKEFLEDMEHLKQSSNQCLVCILNSGAQCDVHLKDAREIGKKWRDKIKAHNKPFISCVLY